MAAWPRVIEAAQKLENGEVLFAHLLMPHHPYVFDAECGVSPNLYRRLNMADESLPGPESNTTRGREQRWQLYLDQAVCMQRRIAELMAVLESTPNGRRASVIIHGDHGARITTLYPFVQFVERLSNEQLRDSYETATQHSSRGNTKALSQVLTPVPEALGSY
jgi:hypothetical protein